MAFGTPRRPSLRDHASYRAKVPNYPGLPEPDLNWRTKVGPRVLSWLCSSASKSSMGLSTTPP
eukprot:11207098-Lingulodinium_polyedra.AAC.1